MLDCFNWTALHAKAAQVDRNKYTGMLQNSSYQLADSGCVGIAWDSLTTGLLQVVQLKLSTQGLLQVCKRQVRTSPILADMLLLV